MRTKIDCGPMETFLLDFSPEEVVRDLIFIEECYVNYAIRVDPWEKHADKLYTLRCLRKALQEIQ